MNKIATFTTVTLFAAILVLPLVACAGDATQEGDVYAVSTKTSGKGDKGAVTVTVTGKDGYKCNILYPWKLTLRDPTGEKVVKKDQAKVFSESKVQFDLGDISLGATKAQLKLSVCNDKQCQNKTVDLSF
jgi:hypothetical protein